MNVIKQFGLTISAALLLGGCTGPSSETEKLRGENTKLRTEIDSLKRVIAETDTTQSSVTVVTADTLYRIRPGNHDFTLQWIGWNQPGRVNIGRVINGWQSIKGGQKSNKNDDYITINGQIKWISGTELLFSGDIVSLVKGNNGSQPCIKSGEKIFKTTQNRKYWRMQDMINCEGGMLTDYVDIYF